MRLGIDMKFTGSKISLLLFLSLIVFHLFGNSIWIALNNTPPAWDQAYHTTKSLEIYQFLKDNSKIETLVNSLSDFYAPLVKIITAVFLTIFPTNDYIKMAQFPGTIFFIATLGIIFLLTLEISKSFTAGLIATFLFSFFQIVYDNSRWLLLDIPLIFFVTSSIYFLLKSDLLQKKGFSILAFFAMSLAVLTKIQAAIYLFLPLIWILINLIKRPNRTYRYLFVGGLLFSFLVSPWIVLSYKNLINYLKIASVPELSDPTNILDSVTWFYYAKIVINHVLTFFVFLFSLPATYYFVKSKNPFKAFILVFSLFYYFLFTLFPNKDMRYLYPIFPFIGIAIACGFNEIMLKSRIKFLVLFIPVMVIDFVFYFSLSFGLFLPHGITKWTMIPKIGDITFFNTSNFPVRKYDKERWPNRQIIQDLYRLSGGKTIFPILIPNFDQFNDNNLRMYITEAGFNNIQITRAGGRNKFLNDKELEDYLNQYEYFIYTDKEFGPSYQIDATAFTQLQGKIRQLWSENQLKVINSYLLPSGQKIYLLKKFSFPSQIPSGFPL